MKNKKYKRLKYKKPELVDYGNIKNITRGGNPDSFSDGDDLGGDS